MNVSEFKQMLKEFICDKVDEKHLPVTITENSLGIFLLKPDSSFEDVVDLLKKQYKSEFTMVESVKIPADHLANNNKILKEYDFSLEGSTLIVEIQSHFKFLLKGENEDDEMEEEDGPRTAIRDRTRDLPFPDKNQLSMCGKVGIRNIGNTCYMNSALQCLSHTTELTDYFLAKEYQKDINQSNVMGTQGRLANAYASLIFEMWNGMKPIVHPNYFRSIMTHFNNSVRPVNSV